jgi:hypothetical protein
LPAITKEGLFFSGVGLPSTRLLDQVLTDWEMTLFLSSLEGPINHPLLLLVVLVLGFLARETRKGDQSAFVHASRSGIQFPAVAFKTESNHDDQND